MKVSWNAQLITDSMMEMHAAPVPPPYRSHAWRVERRRFILVDDDVMLLLLISASPAYPGTLTGNTHSSLLSFHLERWVTQTTLTYSKTKTVHTFFSVLQFSFFIFPLLFLDLFITQKTVLIHFTLCAPSSLSQPSDSCGGEKVGNLPRLANSDGLDLLRLKPGEVCGRAVPLPRENHTHPECEIPRCSAPNVP